MSLTENALEKDQNGNDKRLNSCGQNFEKQFGN
jgi:hypothetical protein